MTRTYYFAGHEALANRGCEALVRGITSIVGQGRPDARYLVPSFAPDHDRAQWSSAVDRGVAFVDAYRLSGVPKAWVRLQARLPVVRQAWLPAPPIPPRIWDQVQAATACIVTGGDVLSLDYGMASLTKYMGQAEHFMRQGRPAVLWGASVGPFAAMPDVEQRVVRHLSRYHAITARETATVEYLQRLGLKGVRLVADPAFAMQPEPFDVAPLLPAEREDGVMGFNVSPLIRLLLESHAKGSSRDMEASVCEFLTDVVTRTRLGIALVPHVDAIDGGADNSDFVYLQMLMRRANLPAARMTLAPRTLNAAQVKFLLSHCRYFFGARTHATIGALSSGVPTCSLGYSIKARGLNRDLFGDERYVLDTKKLSKLSLWKQFERLREDESAIRSLLEARIPQWRQRAHEALDTLP